MAILLNTASVRVSSIQIMQVRVQNKGKSVWKSRYDGDLSWIVGCFVEISSDSVLRIQKPREVLSLIHNAFGNCTLSFCHPCSTIELVLFTIEACGICFHDTLTG